MNPELRTDEEGRTSLVALFLTFLRLGLTSFGGPVAHLGYFRQAFVERRRWLTESAYADLVALCQFLPGPASSQVGMGIGLMRGGVPGALAAWLGFTLPSAALLIAFGYGVVAMPDSIPAGVLQGLKLAAVAVVARAVWGMGRALCPDRERVTLAVVGLLLAALYDPVWTAGIRSTVDFSLALVAFVLLVFWRTPPWLVVVLAGIARWVLAPVV